MPKAPPGRRALDPQGAAALAAAYDTWAAPLFATARRLVGEPADAEECVQEVFVKFAERSGALAPIADLGAYLFTSLRHAVAARSKQEERQNTLLLQAAPPAAAIAPNPAFGDTRALQLALQRLPFEQREVVALKIDGELTFAQIGVLLGVNPNTAASRYRYALARLKAALAEENP